MNALRRFKYRQLLRIGARDLLGDADLSVTTEELSRLADACLAEAWRDGGGRRARAVRRAARRRRARETGLAVIGMGKLGGEELNYSSDIDLMFVYGADGETAGGPEGGLANGDYFARVCRDIVAMHRGRRPTRATRSGSTCACAPRAGRARSRCRSTATAPTTRERAELWERQALLKARACGRRRSAWARASWTGRARSSTGPALDERVRARHPRHEARDRPLRCAAAATGSARNVKLGRGGIREIEFIVQALQLLYGGDDPWLRERNTLKALFRLTERGYLAPELGRALSHALVHLRTVEHRLQILHEFQTHTLPERAAGARAPRPPPRHRRRRRAGRPRVPAPPPRASPATCTARSASSSASGPRRAPPARPRLPSLMALGATGFADPERARQNLRLILEGRPLVPYAGALRRGARAAASRRCSTRSGRAPIPTRR